MHLARPLRIRRLLDALLLSSGFRVFTFSTLDGARAAMMELGQDVSVLICDVNFRDTESVLKIARQFARVPIVLTSARGELSEAFKNAICPGRL